MRKAYEGLSALVREQLGRDLLRGDLFLFVGRTRTRAKVLLFDGTGLCIFMKRLEKGHFAAPWERAKGDREIEMTMSELALLLEGAEPARDHAGRPCTVDRAVMKHARDARLRHR